MTDLISNRLDLTIVLGVLHDEVRLNGMQSEELPWLADDGDPYTIQPRCIVESALLPLVNRTSRLGKQLATKTKILAGELSAHLEEVLEINCNFRLHLLLEELESGALEALRKRLKIKDASRILDSLESVGSLDWKESPEVSEEKASQVDLLEVLQLLDFAHEGSPGSTVSLSFHSDHSFPLWAETITLRHQGKQVLKHASRKELPPGKSTVISLPAIPVRHYGPMLDSGEALDLEVHFRGVSDPVMIESALNLSLPPLESPPASFFFDMGSVQCKQMVVSLAAAPTATNHPLGYWSKATCHRLEDSKAAASCFWLPAPLPSQVVIEHFELPEIRKEEIDGYDDRQLAAHFARAIQLIARSHCARQKGLIGDFYWAFPNVRKRNFKLINRELKKLVGASILGQAIVAAESDCLRSQFAKPLNGLSSEAKAAFSNVKKSKRKKKELEAQLRAATSAWNAYESKGFLGRAWDTITGARPPAPDGSKLSAHQVPSLQEWHEKFKSIACDESLSDYLVFDAGGYTLDVYGSIQGQSGRKTFSQSYKAGSNRITEAIQKKLAEERGQTLEEIGLEEAETLKVLYCGEEMECDVVLGRLCRDTSREVYAGPIEEVTEWLHENRFTRGIPVILSGGGSRNRHFRVFLSEQLKEKGFGSVPIDSGLIYVTLGEASESESPDRLLFREIVSGFNLDDEIPRYSPLTDVIGGLAMISLHANSTENKS